MKSINTYGLKIKGLRNACGNTVNWDARSGGYTEIFYDRSNGEVWTVDQISLGFNSWTEYHDPDVIKVCNTSRHMTMQEIADAIYNTINRIEEEDLAC
jgi:hypothetical protein